MFDTLTSDLLDLTATVQGRPLGRFAVLLSCCSSCCCCGQHGESED
jgi:hypothetical protein